MRLDQGYDMWSYGWGIKKYIFSFPNITTEVTDGRGGNECISRQIENVDESAPEVPPGGQTAREWEETFPRQPENQ